MGLFLNGSFQYQKKPFNAKVASKYGLCIHDIT